jgi:hypothetical protein
VRYWASESQSAWKGTAWLAVAAWTLATCRAMFRGESCVGAD